MPVRDDRERVRMLRTVCAVVLFYAAGSLLAWHGFGANVGLAFFPPAGVTVAALMLTPRRTWPALLVAVFLTEVTIDVSQHLGLGASIGYGAANTLEPFVAVLVFDAMNRSRVPLDQRRGKLSFIAGACGVGALAGALVGASVTMWHRPETQWVSNVVHWWAGDGLAMLAIGASIVLVATTRLSRRQRVELVAGAVVTAFASWVGLNSLLAPSTIILPVLTILAFRIGAAGATIGGSVFALVANYATNAGHGYFADLDASTTDRLALAQVFIAVLVIVGWSIGVEIQARVEAVSMSARLELQRDEATAAVKAIHRAVGPSKADTSGCLRIGSCYRQSNVAELVGGDWFDVFELPEARVMLVVGDVVGHGVNAMEDMAHLRLASRAFASEGHGPARILEELNHYTEHSTQGHFATMIVGIHDPAGSKMVFASAGHPPPLLRRSNDRSSYLPVHPGLPLGANKHPTYVETQHDVEVDDIVVLYTDGVIERRGHTLDEGFDTLARALDAADGGASPDRICEQLIEQCFPTVHTSDDRCLLLISVGPISRTA